MPDDYNVICPYCETEYTDSWEYFECDEDEIVCQECDKTFIVTANHVVTFNCEKQNCENKDPEQEHNYVFEKLHHKDRNYGRNSEGEYVWTPCDDEYYKIMVCSECDDEEYIRLTEDEYETLKADMMPF